MHQNPVVQPRSPWILKCLRIKFDFSSVRLQSIRGETRECKTRSPRYINFGVVAPSNWAIDSHEASSTPLRGRSILNFRSTIKLTLLSFSLSLDIMKEQLHRSAEHSEKLPINRAVRAFFVAPFTVICPSSSNLNKGS